METCKNTENTMETNDDDVLSETSDNTESLYLVCIRKQLEEYNLLSSAYSAEELSVQDGEEVLKRLEEYITSKDTEKFLQPPSDYLDYTLLLKLPQSNETNGSVQLQVNICLPHLYPGLERPSVLLFSRDIEMSVLTKLKEGLIHYLNDVYNDEPYLFEIIHWLQENLGQSMGQVNQAAAPPPTINHSITSVSPDLQIEFFEYYERVWIYSHHIVAPSKRQQIIQLANQLNLSGFSRPGKPGIICVEGLRENAEQFWREIKSTSWKKIRIIKIESKKLRGMDRGLREFRRFSGFEELTSSSVVDEEQGNEKHEKYLGIDMKGFIKYLEKHNSGYIKYDLFGIP